MRHRVSSTDAGAARRAAAGAVLAAVVCTVPFTVAAGATKPIPTPVQQLTDPRTIESPANAAAAPVPLPDLSAIRGAFGATWTPDGKAVVVSTNLTGRFNLWRIDLGGNFPAQLTRSDEVQVPVAVTPDAKVLYLEDHQGDELNDLYAVPLSGGIVTNLTKTPEHTEDSPRLSPDGALVAMTRRAKTGTIGDLVVLDRRSGEVRPLTKEQDPSRLWVAGGWSPDGRTVYATRTTIDRSRAAVYAVDVATGTTKALTAEKAGRVASVTSASKDGSLLAITSNERTGQDQAGLLEVATGTVRWLQPTPWEQTSGWFSPDGSRVVVQTNADGRASLAVVDVRTLAQRELPFPPGVVGETSESASSWRPDGARLLVRSDAGDSPLDYWLVDPATGTSERVTRLAMASLDPANLPKTRIVSYRSFDGTPISAVLTIPFNAKRDGSHPAVVIPHGGPTSQSRDTFSRDATALASRGYFVIRPNFRGSTGYGQAFQEANKKDLGGGDLEDTVAAADFLVATGYVDRKRIGITGGSYGGFMTLMALGRKPDVFAAGVNQFGIINWFTMWENAVGGLREYQRALVGDPVKDRAAYERQSPMTYVRQMRAPLLVLQGENDVRVPKGQADEVVQLVRQQGGTVEAVYYPKEGHGFARLENAEDARRRMIDWFDRYLKAPAAGAATKASR